MEPYQRLESDYQRLESEWAKFNDLDPAGMVACSSGTAALHLALEAFRLPAEYEVIVPDLTMVACPRAVVMAGLTPVFVDCRENLLMDPGLMRDAVSTTTLVLMLVHVYGRRSGYGGPIGWPHPMNDLYVLEDLAEAHGVRPHPDTDAACWSFYKNKIVAGEEGGAVWFRDPEHARLARSLRSLGFTDAHDFRHVPRGHNYRMSNLHAKAILNWWDAPTYPTGRPAIEIVFEYRCEIEGWYDEFCPTEWRMPRRDAVWVYDLRIPGMTEDVQDRVVKTLKDNGIAARHCFKPMSEQEEFQGCRVVGSGNAARLSREVIYLPVRPGETTREDAALAFRLIRSVVG